MRLHTEIPEVDSQIEEMKEERKRRGHRGRVRRCLRMTAMRRIMGGHLTSYFIALATQRASLAGAHSSKSSRTCLQTQSHTRDTKDRY
jgi:hypothetical protein